MINKVQVGALISVLLGSHLLNASPQTLERTQKGCQEDQKNKQQIADEKYQARRRALLDLYTSEGISTQPDRLDPKNLISPFKDRRGCLQCIPFDRAMDPREQDKILALYNCIKMKLRAPSPRIVLISDLQPWELGLTLRASAGPYGPVFRPVIVDQKRTLMMIEEGTWKPC